MFLNYHAFGVDKDKKEGPNNETSTSSQSIRSGDQSECFRAEIASFHEFEVVTGFSTVR